MTNYNLGDIILIEFPHSDLQHFSKRPAIVLYDSGDRDVLVARVTTQEYSAEADYKIFGWKESGLLAESYIRLAKHATIEKQYILKTLGKLKSSEIENIKTILRKIFLL